MLIKIITGFRDDQFVVIDGEEAHKAYYLFTHPEERAIFENGVAMIGKNIQSIIPAWNEIMGWNPTHKLSGDDWNEIRRKGIERDMKKLLCDAREVALHFEKNPTLVTKPLSEAIGFIPKENKELSDSSRMLAKGMKM